MYCSWVKYNRRLIWRHHVTCTHTYIQTKLNCSSRGSVEHICKLSSFVFHMSYLFLLRSFLWGCLHSMILTIEIFNYKYPNGIAIFIFDCSSAHEAFSTDALLAHKINCGPGGQQPLMQDTVIPQLVNHSPWFFRLTNREKIKMVRASQVSWREWNRSCVSMVFSQSWNRSMKVNLLELGHATS